MKNILRLFLLGIAGFCQGQSVTLQWQYNSNSIAQSALSGYPYSFKIYATNQLVSLPSTWPVIYNQFASNTPVVAFDGTNYTFGVSNQIVSSAMFFTSTASNAFWGESAFSNTSGVPSIPTVLHSIILKN